MPHWITCPICKKNTINGDKFTECLDCMMENKGWVLCEECFTDYYDPKKFVKCYKCCMKERKERAGNGYP